MQSLPLDRLAVLTAAFLFSTGGTVIKLTSWGGFEVAGGRALLAALVLWALFPSWRRFWTPGALAVGVAYAATMVLFVVANKLTTAANAIFLQSTAPLYVLALAPWWLGERSRLRELGLAGVLFAGLVLFFVGSQDPTATAPDPTLGNWVAAASGVGWACTVVGLRRVARRGPPPAGSPAPGDGAGAAVVAGNVIAFAACLPFVVTPASWAPVDLAAVGYLGFVQVGLAYVLLNRGIAGVPALEASLLLLLEPVLSAGLAGWVHGERPGPWALAGGAVILGATAARTWSAARDAARIN